MRKRRIFALIFVLLLIALVIGVVYFRGKGAPEAARLLPEGKAIVYVDLATIRLATDFGDSPVQREKEYDEFVEATGFQFERDLDEVALVMHEVPVAVKKTQPRSSETNPDPKSKPAEEKPVAVVSEPRYSEILIGRFNSERVLAWLRKQAQTVDKFGDTEIFNIPHEDRTVRVAILDVDTVAISNTEDSAIIKGMVERHRSAAHPFAGPALVREFYSEVPFASVAWAIAEVASKNEKTAADALRLSSPLRSWLGGSTLVGSISYKGFINLRVQALAKSEEHAKEIQENASTWLGLFKVIQLDVGSPELDKDIADFFESIKIERKGSKTVLDARVSPSMVEKIFAEPPVGDPGTPETAPAEDTAPAKK